jgi:DNA-binding LacI/PurR family transcriptional regulator
MKTKELSRRQKALSAFKLRLRVGRWKSGVRLPTRPELVKTLKISPMTLQLIIDQLAEEGFVESRGREGTFAAASPPFTRNIGIVLRGGEAERETWFHYWRVLETVATQLCAGSQRRAQFYYGIEKPLSSELERLRRDIDGHCLAGVFFSDLPRVILNSGVLNQTHTPLVAVGDSSECGAHVSSLKLDTDRFFDVAMKEVVRAGRRRVGLITPWEDPREHLPAFFACAKKHGLEALPRWCLYAPHSSGGRFWATYAVQTLLAGSHRPDALLIYDDNLIEAGMAGMREVGCAVPDECLVVAHANFPMPIASPYPLIRVGIDIPELLQAAFDEIQRRQHKTQPRHIRIPLHTASDSASRK